MASKKSRGAVFYENGSWHHRAKIFTECGTTKYVKKSGFATKEKAEMSYRQYEEAYTRAYRAHHASDAADFELRDYLIFWLDEIYSPRIENTTKMLASYVLYDLILPHMKQGIKLRYVNADYLDELLSQAASACESAGNKCRELLNIALKDAVLHGYILNNPVPSTRPYKRKKTTVQVLNKQQIKVLLEKAAENNWYLEILLALFLGLRKGEISGLKFSDFNLQNKTVAIARQITANPIVEKHGSKILKYQMIEKEPKTPNSYRTMRVPAPVMEEVIKRKQLNDCRKELKGDAYIDNDYLSCSENGLPHATAAFNTALTKLCARNGLPHITVHSLRHMYAGILLEQGVPLVKISALLGHASVHTTFEYYCEVIDEEEEIRGFLNQNFVPEGESNGY